MSEHLYGFEGSLEAEVPVHFATAAILRDGFVYNEATNERFTIPEAEHLSQCGYLHRFQRPQRLRHPVPAGKGATLLIVRRDSPAYPFAKVDTGRASGSIPYTRVEGNLHYVLFRTGAQFENVRRDRLTAIIQKALEQKRTSTLLPSLIEAGSLLAPNDPVINALRVFLKPQAAQAGALELARQLVPDVERLNETYASLTTTNDYLVEYKEGVASTEGLELDSAVRIIRSFQTIADRLRPVLKSLYEWIPEWPSPAMYALEPGSAKVRLTTKPRTEAIGETLARHYHLKHIQQAIEGSLDAESNVDNVKFRQALATVRKPSDETDIRHKPLLHPEDTELVPVGAPDADANTVLRERVIRIICYTVGASAGRRVEIAIGPKSGRFSGRLWLSLANDGTGRPPEGAELLADTNDFMYRPFVVDLLVQETRSHSKYRLQSLARLAAEPTPISHLPSAVIAGAFVSFDSPVSVAAMGHTLAVNGTKIADTPFTNAGFQHALRELSAFVRSAELDPASGLETQWFTPVRSYILSESDRVMVALASNGGRMSFDNLIDDLNTRFSTFVRVNNTRRAIRASNALVRMSTPDDGTPMVALTESGMACANVLRDHHPSLR